MPFTSQVQSVSDPYPLHYRQYHDTSGDVHLCIVCTELVHDLDSIAYIVDFRYAVCNASPIPSDGAPKAKS